MRTQTQGLFPDIDEDIPAFDGDPPSREEEAHAAEVDYLIFEFDKVANLKVDLIFELRHAVGLFAGRKSKLALDDSDATAMKDAVATALRAALRNSTTRRLRFLRRGMAAIAEAIDAWSSEAPSDRHVRYIRNATIATLKHELAMTDIAASISEHSPATWARRQNLTRDAEPLWS